MQYRFKSLSPSRTGDSSFTVRGQEPTLVNQRSLYSWAQRVKDSIRKCSKAAFLLPFKQTNTSSLRNPASFRKPNQGVPGRLSISKNIIKKLTKRRTFNKVTRRFRKGSGGTFSPSPRRPAFFAFDSNKPNRRYSLSAFKSDEDYEGLQATYP